MSRLEELIEKLCPDGVEYKKIIDVADVSIGEFVHKSKQNPNSQYPVFNGGTSNTGFYDEYNRTANKIIISARGANAGFVNRVFTNFWSGNSCYTVDFSDDAVNLNFAFYWLKSKEKKLLGEQQKGGIPAVSKKQVEGFPIPVPPIEVQAEIVKILDVFAEYTAILADELTARKKQYDEIAYRLLIKYNVADRYSVKDICSVTKGKTPIQKAEPGDYPLVVTTQERKNCNTYQYDDEAVCIPLVSSRGHGVASLNHVYYQEGKFALGNILCAMTSNNKSFVLAKYLYYYFECTKDYTLVPLMKGGANVSMHIPDIEKVKVPVPSIETQKDIIAKLEILEEYFNTALPAEIEARQKQYEYYRDKLLTFKDSSC